MSLNYNNLWKLANISSNVLARMGKNEPVSLESLEKICIALDCSIQDVLTIEKGE